MASEERPLSLSLETARYYANNTEAFQRVAPQLWEQIKERRKSTAMQMCHEVVEHQPLRGMPDLTILSAWKLNLEAKILQWHPDHAPNAESLVKMLKMKGYNEQDSDMLLAAVVEAGKQYMILMGNEILDEFYAEKIAKFKKASEAKKNGQIAKDGKKSITKTERAGAVDGDTHKNGDKSGKAKVESSKKGSRAVSPAKSAKPAK